MKRGSEKNRKILAERPNPRRMTKLELNQICSILLFLLPLFSLYFFHFFNGFLPSLFSLSPFFFLFSSLLFFSSLLSSLFFFLLFFPFFLLFLFFSFSSKSKKKKKKINGCEQKATKVIAFCWLLLSFPLEKDETSSTCRKISF